MTIFFSEQSVPIEDQTSQDIFLLLDEVPCNGDSGKWYNRRPSGDWKGLKTYGVNLMMVLKPISSFSIQGIDAHLVDKIMSRKRAIDLCFPENFAHLQLSRIYRCTKNIVEFYEEIVKHVNINVFNKVNFGINSSSISYSPGHEIHGDYPEVLFLAKCNCYGYCKNPVEELLQANKTKILAMLKRIKSKFSLSEITVLIDIKNDDQKCVNWLRTELMKENGTVGNIVFKTIEQCRGLEFPVLLTISENSNYYMRSKSLDAWTRVTASLFIIQMKDTSTVSQGLIACLKKKVAKRAEEQEEIRYSFLKILWFLLQNPSFRLTGICIIGFSFMTFFFSNDLFYYLAILFLCTHLCTHLVGIICPPPG